MKPASARASTRGAALVWVVVGLVALGALGVLATRSRREALGTASMSAPIERQSERRERLPVGAANGGASPGGGVTTAYPPGHWRTLDRGVLGSVVLWVSHILIRHGGSAANVSFAPSQWQAGPLPARSRGEALALAERVAAEAFAGNFASLAERWSEDAATRFSGGSLGGISAVELAADPEVLDALEATPLGAASRVVESRYGFHVLLRRAPPPETLVTGAHIVIGHDDARWLQEYAARRAIPVRSRAEALRRANELYSGLRAAPDRFGAGVAEASEHRDAAWGGDLGTWSTRERAAFPRQVEILAELDVGAVAPPIETLFGYEIIMRLPNPPRQQLAMSALRLRYDPKAADVAPTSRASVELEARALAPVLASELGARSGEALGVPPEHCCVVQARWQEGRAYGGLTSAVARLAIGQASPEPIEWESSFYILRRIAPDALPSARPALLDFPE
jgi:parvulin-like peptidyl-prolyl cis-trans isomerase-like protein/PPIC-type peptidyl-prolyl cis-trans isomerase-like protein